MTKKLLLLFAAIVATAAIYSQEYKTSMGVRAGLPAGISAKHFMNRSYGVEGIVATRWGGFVMTGLFEREYPIRDYPGLNWYWGAGAHLGVWDAGYNPRIRHEYSGAVPGIDGVIGIEYTSEELPLNLSFDLIPSTNLAGGAGWGGINGALSIRYVF